MQHGSILDPKYKHIETFTHFQCVLFDVFGVLCWHILAMWALTLIWIDFLC